LFFYDYDLFYKKKRKNNTILLKRSQQLETDSHLLENDFSIFICRLCFSPNNPIHVGLQNHDRIRTNLLESFCILKVF